MKLDDATLMQHVDGELPNVPGAPGADAPDADEQLERLLAADPVARAKADAVAELGELVRGHLELAADAVPERRFDHIWREIDKAIAAPAVAAAAATPVTARAPSPSESVAIPAANAAWWRRAVHWLERKRGYVMTAMVSAGAVAAIALIARPTGISAGAGELAPNGEALDVRAVAHRPAEIESLDTPGGTGTVLRLQHDDDGDATVIWVTPEDTVEGI